MGASYHAGLMMSARPEVTQHPMRPHVLQRQCKPGERKGDWPFVSLGINQYRADGCCVGNIAIVYFTVPTLGCRSYACGN